MPFVSGTRLTLLQAAKHKQIGLRCLMAMDSVSLLAWVKTKGVSQLIMCMIKPVASLAELLLQCMDVRRPLVLSRQEEMRLDLVDLFGSHFEQKA